MVIIIILDVDKINNVILAHALLVVDFGLVGGVRGDLGSFNLVKDNKSSNCSGGGK